jgi:hypothetical protein
MKRILLGALAASLMLVSGAQAALITADNGLAAYDTETNLTWVLDGDIIGWSYFVPATAAVAALEVGGETGWRMASQADDELGGLYNEHGITAADSGPFINLNGSWTDTPIDGSPSGVWGFSFHTGSYVGLHKGNNLAYTLAVQDGDVFNVVPIPAAVWLFGSALGGLGWMRRRKTV